MRAELVEYNTENSESTLLRFIDFDGSITAQFWYAGITISGRDSDGYYADPEDLYKRE